MRRYLFGMIAVLFALVSFAFQDGKKADHCPDRVWFEVNPTLGCIQPENITTIHLLATPVEGDAETASEAFNCPLTLECVCGVGYLPEDINPETGLPVANPSGERCYIYKYDQ